MNWFLLALSKYTVFSGRSQRSEYWYFVLFGFLISIGLAIIDLATGLVDPQQGIGLFSGIFSLALLIPNITAGVRRLHDTGRSGWWMLLAFIPIIGAIVLIVFYAQDSQPNENRFGPNPKVLT